jgi:hypothetical protein
VSPQTEREGSTRCANRGTTPTGRATCGCPEVVPALTCDQPDGSTPERGYDGARGWGNNWPYAADSVALRAFPTLGTGQWVDWLGHWGGTRNQSGSASPDSPGNQGHYLEPWDQCGENGEYCPAAARNNRRRRPTSPAPTACRSWFGPHIAAVSCDARRMKRAVRKRQLGRPGTARAALAQRGTTSARMKGHRRRIGRAPGLVQVLSKPLSRGDRLRLSGRASGPIQIAWPFLRGDIQTRAAKTRSTCHVAR